VDILIRPVRVDTDEEIKLVATRMRATLVEVLDEERGRGMYTMDWLMERVRSHLDGGKFIGQVFVAEANPNDIVGHTIVRVDEDEEGAPTGLFSTFYVVPSARNSGIASRLLKHGEKWMLEQGLGRARTYTHEDNPGLQQLCMAHGYSMKPMPDQFVLLDKALIPTVAP